LLALTRRPKCLLPRYASRNSWHWPQVSGCSEVHGVVLSSSPTSPCARLSAISGSP
jgi:hypothetical protein